MVVWSEMRKYSTPAISAKFSTCSLVSAGLKAVWCAPPARIHAAAAVAKSGLGSHTVRATGNFGSAGCSTAVTSFASRRKRLPKSTSEALMDAPGLESNTKRTGSALPPMPSGWISTRGCAAAIVGQISSICAPSTLRPSSPMW